MPTLYLPCDSLACAVGADEVATALITQAHERDLPLELQRTSSRGLYWLEPLLEVDSPQGRIGFGPLTAADVPSVLEALNSSTEHPLSLGLVEELPYLKTQQRLLFARAGITRPLSLDDYRAHGGFEGLARAVAIGGEQDFVGERDQVGHEEIHQEQRAHDLEQGRVPQAGGESRDQAADQHAQGQCPFGHVGHGGNLVTQNGTVGYSASFFGNCCRRNYDVDYSTYAPFASLSVELDRLTIDASIRYDYGDASGTITGSDSGFGTGSAALRFVQVLGQDDFWTQSLQKSFQDIV